MSRVAGGKHPSHVTRPSTATTHDEECINCGERDISGGGWGLLAEPCRKVPAATRTLGSSATFLDPRRAGQVTRYHTWPRLREQSVGEHSWQVLRILVAIWPEAPRHLLIHAVTHDVGETASGDPPYPVKALNPVLKQECDRIEGEAHDLMSQEWGLPPRVALTEYELVVFKLAEFIEMWEWGLFEVSMGNSCAGLVVERCVEGMLNREQVLRRDYPQNHQVADVLRRAANYTEKRSVYVQNERSQGRG